VISGLALPAFIILGCALLAGAVAFATRRKRALWDILPGSAPAAGTGHNGPELYDIGAEYSTPQDQSGDDDADIAPPTLELVGEPPADTPTAFQAARVGPEVLGQWHQRCEQTVSAWIENHQRVLGEINASGLQVDLGRRDQLLAGHEDLAPKMREAIASHPSPVMRAELSALHVAGEATVFAVMKSDYETARRQHLVYVQYRDEWIERLRQFSEEPMSNLRAVINTDEFELEEIRAALEAALAETEALSEVEPCFEAPLMVRDDPDRGAGTPEQQADTLESAIGTPADTTADLERGRLRRLLRRRISPKAAGDEE